MKRSVVRAVLAMTSCLMMLQAVHAEEEIDTSPPSESLPAIVTFGGRASDSIVEGLVDVLIPFHEGPDLVLFLNPRLSGTDRSEEEANIGVGVRKLLADRNIILGANAYYDSRWTRHDNQFNQFGFGVEMLSEWIDARANFYKPENKSEVIDVEETETSSSRVVSEKWGRPEPRGHDIRQDVSRSIVTTTTRQRFERFEEAMEGFDAEVGILLPFLMDLAETRVFGGYYRFDSKFGDDLEGMKARVEVRALPGLTLDAEYYEDKELHGSDYFVGARVHVPFNIGHLISGRNPFEGAGESFKRGEDRPFRSRMTEMVIRDIKIQQEESGFIENEAARTETSKRSDTRESVAVVKDINFVDQDSTSPIENGTWEHPYTAIQDGVDNVFGRRNVFVLAASGPYEENVVLKDGVKLIGSSLPIRLNGGHWFFVGGLPVVDGMNLGPTITMANKTFVGGFGIANTDFLNPAMDVTVAGETFDVSRAGIVGINKTDLVVARNIIVDTGLGIGLAADNVKNFRVKVKDNFVIGNEEVGIGILGQGASGAFHADVTGNFVIGNNGIGLGIDAFDYNRAGVKVDGNIIVGNNGPGLAVALEALFGVTFINHNNISVGNNGPGMLFFGAAPLGPVRADTRNAISVGNNGEGLLYQMINTVGGIDASFHRVIAAGNNGPGMIVVGQSVLGDVNLMYDRIFAIANASDGVQSVGVSVFGDVYTGMNNVLAAGNGSSGINAVGISAFGDVDLWFDRMLVGGNTGPGVIAQGISTFGDVYVGGYDIFSIANGGPGMLLQGVSQSGDVDIWLADIASLGNGADGILAQGVSAEGDAYVGMLNVHAHGNAGQGVFATAISSSSRASVALEDVRAIGNGGMGILAQAIGNGGAIARLEDSRVNDNANGGVLIQAISDSRAGVVVDDARAMNNGGVGLFVQSIGNLGAFARLEDIQANGNVGDGTLIQVVSGAGRAGVDMENVRASDNAGQGILMQVVGTLGAGARLENVQVNDNTGIGALIQIVSGSGPARVEMERVQALNNGAQGILLQIVGETGARAELEHVQLNGNTSEGLLAAIVANGAGNAILIIRESQLVGNGAFDALGTAVANDGHAVILLDHVDLDTWNLLTAAPNGIGAVVFLP